MCCFLVVPAVLGPRVALAMEWLFTNRVAIAFHNGVALPLLGLIFAPWTTLIYTLAYAPGRGVSTLGWVCVAVGVLADLGSWTSGPAQRRRAHPALA